MKASVDYSLYLVTDSALITTNTVDEAVEQAIKGGCTVVQLREKEKSTLDFYNIAVKVKDVCSKYGIPLIINDRIDIALAVDADGVHIGQEDMPAKIARTLIGHDKILGISASNIFEAREAEDVGADYVGVGAMFTTQTKTNAALVSMEELKKIRASIELPIIAIGGINKHTISLFEHTGIDGIAVVSAIVAEKDIVAASKEMLSLFLENMRYEND